MMAFRHTGARLCTTAQPPKMFRNSFQPDPRKLMPFEKVHNDELFPHPIRPPCSEIPDHQTFLQRIDTNEHLPTAEFAGSFESWHDLMNCSRRKMRQLGIPSKSAVYIRRMIDRYHNGDPPTPNDQKEERAYWKQFKNRDSSRRRKMAMPAKYRPHQSGVPPPGLPNYQELNTMPEWAIKEEARLAEKQNAKKQ